MLNLVLFGPPGAGKGTQSENIIKEYDLVHLSTGDLFRKHLGEGTALGQLAQKFMDEGNLVPDAVVIDMVKDKIASTEGAKGFIFDGFPRTVAQAEALDEMLKEFDTEISGMVALDVADDELRTRLLERGKTSGRADDQNVDKINNRINVYKSETIPVAEFYEGQGKFNKINGIGSIEGIFADIKSVVDKF